MFLRILISILIIFTGLHSYAAELLPVVKQRFFDANGDPLAGGKLYSYEAGTTTPKATYTDRGALTANANPVILDANGEADVWIGSGYFKFVLKDSNDVTQWTKDSVSLPSEAALASAFWRDVVYITSADSPYTITSAMNGKLISVDTTSGAVVINMPEISGLTLPFNVGVKINTLVSSVTISRAGTDTIEGSTSKVLSSLNAGAQFIADIDKSPDQWAVLDIGTVADGAISRAKLANGAVGSPNVVSKSSNYTATTSDDIILVTATCTITLPAANTSGLRPITVIVASSGITVTIARTGADTILGETSQTMITQYSAVDFIADGTSTYYIK